MKKWFAKKLIGLSAITGWRLPEWIRNLMTAEEFESLMRAEDHLTHVLKNDDAGVHEMPPFLESRIERALANESATTDRPFRFPGWGVAAVAILVLALSVFVFLPEPGNGNMEEPLVTSVAVQTLNPVATPELEKKPLRSVARDQLAGDVLLEPLVEEQARLAADMTDALQFMANSLLPLEYANQVNRNLESFKEELGKSI